MLREIIASASRLTYKNGGFGFHEAKQHGDGVTADFVTIRST